MKDHLNAYYLAEKEKGILVNKYPLEMRVAASCTKQVMNGSDLQNLQFLVEPKKRYDTINPTVEIYGLIGSVIMADICESLKFLRRVGSDDLKHWLTNIDEGLKERIREQKIQPIVTSPTLLHRGNIPDGNHRVLAALEMYKAGESISLLALQLHIPHLTLASINALVFADRFSSNPNGTMKIFEERFGSKPASRVTAKTFKV